MNSEVWRVDVSLGFHRKSVTDSFEVKSRTVSSIKCPVHGRRIEFLDLSSWCNKTMNASLIWCRSGVGSTDNFCFISPKIIVQFLLDVNHEMLIPVCVHQHGKKNVSISSVLQFYLLFLNGWIVQHEPHALGKKISFDPGIGFFLNQEMQTKHFQNNPENFLGRLRKKL